jgi:hypothetical protein
MSDDNKEDVKNCTNSIVISVEDAENLYTYSSYFEVPLSDDLKTAIEGFKAEQSLRAQTELRLQIAKWILTSEHESFKDELWNEVKECCQPTQFELEFSKELETSLERQ